MSVMDSLTMTGHVPTVHFYRRPESNGEDGSSFFEAEVLKEALSKVLVAFYPIAGRLARDENGRLEIDCNEEGVLFFEAQTNCVLDDLGDFTPSFKISQLVPKTESFNHFSSCPLLVIQLTFFKCGGVCLGIGLHHAVADGPSGIHFINTWADVACGLPISIAPFIDPTILHAMTPPNPTFDHTEYHSSPSMKTQQVETSAVVRSTSVASLKISSDQINTLKARLEKDYGAKCSTYEILTAHIWRCLCKARGLSDDQPTRLYIPTDGRSRLNPPLPSGYLGNVIFITSLIFLSDEIQSEPLISTIEKIHKELKRRDDEYLKSALAYLEQNHDEMTHNLFQRAHSFKSPNLKITSWSHMPIYEADFGWGRPIFVGRASLPIEGATYILPGPYRDKSLSLVLCLETHHMELFKKLFYDFDIEGWQ
ncbi:shikimate O-hydroxycinnamoyltransferase-like [Pistacia vera]|uniref:shikimate O-hydroxycinnamoyltransferase-like n=1 Tax=Pistacia vera TaxID=55513 RepID=UPI001262B1E6|nr:shikimate O-hydroxycinnamoyltransferase-like [Pistacia vera]